MQSVDQAADQNPRETSPRRRTLKTTTALVALVGIVFGFGAARLLDGTGSDDGEAEVETLVERFIAAWDDGDGEAVVALMTEDGVHTCPLGHFSVAEDGGAELVSAVGSMDGDEFTVISGPIVSEAEAPLEAVSIVRISGLVDVLGIARHSVVEQEGDLRIAESEYTHL